MKPENCFKFINIKFKKLNAHLALIGRFFVNIWLLNLYFTPQIWFMQEKNVESRFSGS